MSERLFGIRGATQVDEDRAELVTSATQALVREMLSVNGLEPADIVSILFTGTPDLHSTYPAFAARALGLDAVPLMGAQEMDVTGGMPRVIRVLMHAYCKNPPEHVYHGGAQALRRTGGLKA